MDWHSVSEKVSFGKRVFVIVFVIALFRSPAASAQTADPSHWGVSFSYGSWSFLSQLEDLIEDDKTAIDIEGSDLTVGFVRGSKLGGDWGVSFVSMPFKNGSGGSGISEDCFQPNLCFPSVETDQTEDVKLTGVKFHWFWRIVNIKRRAQIGLNMGGGIAKVSGTIIQTTDEFVVTGFNPQTQRPTVAPNHKVERLNAADELIPTFPLVNLELQGSFIVAAPLKVQVAGGLNFPGQGVRIGLVYLFGAR